jgi:hypothetical protein
MRTRKVKLLLFLLGLISQLGFYLFKKIDYHLYQQLLSEDAFIENWTSLNYFLCSIVVLVLSKSNLGLVKKYALSAFFMFIALEEISYGQRLFSFQSSNFWKETNIQAESNLHNMPYIHEYIIPMAYCTISFVVTLLFLSNKLSEKFKFPLFLSPYFLWIGVVLPIVLIGKFVDVSFFWFVEPIDVESSELILSFGFLFLIFYKMRVFNSELN